MRVLARALPLFPEVGDEDGRREGTVEGVSVASEGEMLGDEDGLSDEDGLILGEDDG